MIAEQHADADPRRARRDRDQAGAIEPTEPGVQARLNPENSGRDGSSSARIPSATVPTRNEKKASITGESSGRLSIALVGACSAVSAPAITARRMVTAATFMRQSSWVDRIALPRFGGRHQGR
jgi:hypothetical protein